MERLVAKRYGKAFFSVAVESGKVEEIKEQVVAVKEFLDTDQELLKFLDEPKVKVEDKIAIVEKLFKSQLDKDFMGLLVLVIKKDRQDSLGAMMDVYLDEYQVYKKQVVAHVSAAATLTDEQVANLKKKIEDGMGKSVQLQVSVDESLIGGLVIRIGDNVIDNSVKGKIERMTKDLRKIQLT